MKREIGGGPIALVAIAIASLVWSTFDNPRPTVHHIKAGVYGGTGVSVATSQGQTLVLTAYHVVRDSGSFTVNGKDAVLIGVDRKWDIAALVVNEVLPVSRLSKRVPQIGDTMTICGYGTGSYKEATGEVIEFATADNVARDWIHMDAPGRSGDSGGPIFYEDGTVGAILWGTDRVGAYGAHCGRVREFLKTINVYPHLIRAVDIDYTIYGENRGLCHLH